MPSPGSGLCRLVSLPACRAPATARTCCPLEITPSRPSALGSSTPSSTLPGGKARGARTHPPPVLTEHLRSRGRPGSRRCAVSAFGSLSPPAAQPCAPPQAALMREGAWGCRRQEGRPELTPLCVCVGGSPFLETSARIGHGGWRDRDRRGDRLRGRPAVPGSQGLALSGSDGLLVPSQIVRPRPFH